MKGDARKLASFEDGSPFLSRVSLGKGNLYFLHALPEEEWSDLADGFTKKGSIVYGAPPNAANSGGRVKIESWREKF